MNDYIEQLESALIDLYEDTTRGILTLSKVTSNLDQDRCKEIEALYNQVKENYEKRHGIN